VFKEIYPTGSRDVVYILSYTLFIVHKHVNKIWGNSSWIASAKHESISNGDWKLTNIHNS
jgi:hypothetical protein